MGIYESYRKGPIEFDHKTGVSTWTEYQEWPGHTNSRTVTATRWVETARDDCFCCSCDDERPGSDPACRNHGWAAQRPCEKHNLPGQPWDDDVNDVGAGMPDSVQVKRAKQAAR